jgi:ABC-type multidrug transport system ATPase subunit
VQILWLRPGRSKRLLHSRAGTGSRNGSGKSTTVKMLTGLLEPTYGEVTYDHQNIHKDLGAYRKALGYVPEEPNLYPFLTCKEYLDRGFCLLQVT